MLQKLNQISQGLNRRFPQGNNPFMIITRLTEECGELAQQVNHFENMGVKNEKHGLPDKRKLVKEIQDVITCALQVCHYYNVGDEFREQVEEYYCRMKMEGHVK